MLKKTLILLISLILVVTMLSCGPSAEQKATAQAVAQDVLSSAIMLGSQGGSKDSGSGNFNFDASLIGGSGTMSVSFSWEDWTGADLGAGYNSTYALTFDADFTYNNFKYTSDSEYTLNGALSNDMDIAFGTDNEENPTKFKYLLNYDIAATNFTATNGTETHTIEIDLTMNGYFEMVLVGMSYNYTENFTLSGTITVDGVPVDASTLELDAEGFFMGL